MQLKFNVIKAILTHDTEIGFKMDPFVVLRLGTQQKRSKALFQAGDMPQFNYQGGFIVQPDQQNLHVIVYDQDLTIDDLVGEVVIDLKPILLQPFTEKKWYSLKYQTLKGLKPAGKIMIEFTCRRNGKLQFPTQQEVKEIMRTKVHRIGVAPEHIGSGKLYGLESDETLRTNIECQNRVGYSDQQMSVGKRAVYSFRNNTVRNENKKNWQAHQNGLAPGYASRIVQKNALQYSSFSKGLVGVQKGANNTINQGYYGLNINVHDQHNYTVRDKNAYMTYQQPQYQNGVKTQAVEPFSKGWCRGDRVVSSNILGNC